MTDARALSREQIEQCIADIREGRPIGVTRAIALCDQALAGAGMGDVLERAADFLDCYAEFIQSVKPYDFERHPYLPELEDVAATLRALIPVAGECKECTGDGSACPYMGMDKAPKDCLYRQVAGGAAQSNEQGESAVQPLAKSTVWESPAVNGTDKPGEKGITAQSDSHPNAPLALLREASSAPPSGTVSVPVGAIRDQYIAHLRKAALAASGPEREQIDWSDRYRVEQQGFWWWVVKCGTGERTLFKAHTKKSCEEMAQELITAFNDGLFADRRQSAPRPEQDVSYWLIEHLHRVPRQYLAIDGSQPESQYWTTEPAKGYRFKSRVEADHYVGVKDEHCGAFEHMDCSGPALTPPDTQPGEVVVPMEPTDEMLDAAANRSHDGHPPLLRVGYEYANMRELWKAMLKAAPSGRAG